MKLYYPTQAQAQDKADSLHQWLIANDADYAASVKAGDTLQWDIPKQDGDKSGTIATSQWQVTILDRCMAALTADEKAALQ